MNDNKYTIVVPVYNSADCLEELCKQITHTLEGYNYNVILVNDGSKDNSWEMISRLKRQYPNTIKAVNLQKNYGQHAALLCAFSFAGGDFIITIDDDLQYDPADILLLIKKQEETNADVVYADIINKQHSALRNTGSFSLKATSKFFEGKNGRGSSFRLIRKDIIDMIVSNHRYNFVYLDEVIQWYTASIEFVPVHHKPRHAGKSGYSLPKLIKLYLNVIINYSASPLKLMTYLGGIFSVITFIMGLVFLHRKLFHRVPMGYTSIIVTILFCASITMFCLGVISQYLFKIFLAQHNKPLYTIRQII